MLRSGASRSTVLFSSSSVFAGKDTEKSANLPYDMSQIVYDMSQMVYFVVYFGGSDENQ